MKKLVAGFLAVCTMLSISISANAEEEQQQQFMTLDEIVDSWIDSMYQGEAEVSKVITLFEETNESSQKVGHLVTFEKSGTPAGYVVFSLKESNNPVLEFSLQGGSIYDYLEGRYADYKSNLSDNIANNEVEPYSMVNDNILYTDFFNYSLVIDNGEDVFLFDQNQQIKELPDTSVGLVMGDGVVLPDGYTVSPPESGQTTGHSIWIPYNNRALLMSDFDSTKNNSDVTALANVIKLYAENVIGTNSAPLKNLKLKDSDEETCKELLSLIGKNTELNNLFDNVLRGYVGKQDYYMENYYSTVTTWNLIDWFMSVKEPLLMRVDFKDGKHHTQVVVGAFKYNDNAQYLSIYSGYYRYPIYIKYGSDSFKNLSGYPVIIY